jgi:peptidoglycan hydrolase-like protein with peptidoglycan-binding domain
VPVAVLRQGSKGSEVEAMERKLDLLRYDVGKVDGRFDGQTWQGLMAFQKLHGLKRTGKFDIATQQELAVSGIPGGLIPNGGLPRVEVDISRQILMYFDEYGLNRVVAVSSGSEKKYCELSKKSGKQNCGDARTPRGNYKIERRIKGKRESDLGTLYSPMYFTGGFAIHGSPSIPAYAASHGCVRITNRTADWMFESIKNGTPVYVFD